MTDSSGLPRRSFLGIAAGTAAALLAPRAARAADAPSAPAASAAGDAGPVVYDNWPGKEAWEQLRHAVGNRLMKPTQPWARLKPGRIPKRLFNPWYLEEQPGLRMMLLHCFRELAKC